MKSSTSFSGPAEHGRVSTDVGAARAGPDEQEHVRHGLHRPGHGQGPAGERPGERDSAGHATVRVATQARTPATGQGASPAGGAGEAERQGRAVPPGGGVDGPGSRAGPRGQPDGCGRRELDAPEAVLAAGLPPHGRGLPRRDGPHGQRERRWGREHVGAWQPPHEPPGHGPRK